MGIEPDIEYCNDCVACFPINKTPKFVYVSFAGIQTGALWIPGFSPPPNGIFKLESVGACLWTGGTATYVFDWKSNLPGTLILATEMILQIAFSYNDPASCVTAGSNQITQPPDRIYHGGKAKIGWNG